jgi:benzoyl-CoA reductase/2-hydroxyglutaryl-CoA dehydratase subunit BcrC/BadD/HgdB
MTVNQFQSKQANTYESEYIETIKSLIKDHDHIKGLKYFLHTTYEYHSKEQMKKRRPEVIVVGTSIPEELVFAFGTRPFWILGGSLGTAMWSDDLVPRDTDPVSRSTLGFLLNPHYDLGKEALIILPVTCDSSRKMAYLLKQAGKNVVTLDIPPEKDDPFAAAKWRKQMENLSEKLADHTGRKITKKSLQDGIQLVETARKMMHEFIQVCEDLEGAVSGAVKMMVLNSYYYTNDLKRWCINLRKLNLEIVGSRKVIPAIEKQKPRILLMGSPVYFPNYKIPFLIEDIGMRIGANLDSTTQKIYTVANTRHLKKDPFGAIIQVHYQCDCSPAYLKNEMLYNSAIWHLKKRRIEGVVFHVLKGQIEYDFELERLEPLFSEHGIPVFRLETDYQYQDVEQLRIRMEAFMEMLSHNRHCEERRAI